MPSWVRRPGSEKLSSDAIALISSSALNIAVTGSMSSGVTSALRSSIAVTPDSASRAVILACLGGVAWLRHFGRGGCRVNRGSSALCRCGVHCRGQDAELHHDQAQCRAVIQDRVGEAVSQRVWPDEKQISFAGRQRTRGFADGGKVAMQLDAGIKYPDVVSCVHDHQRKRMVISPQGCGHFAWRFQIASRGCAHVIQRGSDFRRNWSLFGQHVHAHL